MAFSLNYSPHDCVYRRTAIPVTEGGMNTTLTLVDLAGAVALLIWGVHMVQTGVTRDFGPQLRRSLGYAFAYRMKAFLAGLCVTAILQRRTEPGVMVNTIVASGLYEWVIVLF